MTVGFTATRSSPRFGLEAKSTERLRRPLLACGVALSLYYAAINIYVPTQSPGYSIMSQAVSELSAIGAPTRPLWVLLCIPYTVMVIAFGYGVWMSSSESRSLGAVGRLFIAQGILGVFWPPMHLRGAEPTLTDTLHIAWTVVWLTTMIAAMGFALIALGKRFRVYTAATLIAFVGFGILTSLEGFRLANGLPTSFLGLWERINMGAAMIWIAVLALSLMRYPFEASRSQPHRSGCR
jgi:hypothetical protein